MAPKKLPQSEKAHAYVLGQRRKQDAGTIERNGDAPETVAPVVHGGPVALDLRAIGPQADRAEPRNVSAGSEPEGPRTEGLEPAAADVDRPEPRRLTLGERIARRLGWRVGRGIKWRMGGEAMDGHYVITTGQKSAGKTAAVAGVVSAGTIIGVFGMIRAFWPELIWPAEMDGDIADHIAGAITAIVAAGTALGYLWGLATNIYKNWQRVRNGIKLTPNSDAPVFDWAPKE